MQYKFFLVTTLWALCLSIVPSLALADKAGKEQSDNLCDALKEDCSQQIDVTIAEVSNE